jgi:hypothetical protein
MGIVERLDRARLAHRLAQIAQVVLKGHADAKDFAVSERLNRATFVTHTDQWPMPSCLTTAKQPSECN